MIRVTVAAALLCGSVLAGQTTNAPARTRLDSVILRARSLVDSGKAADARKLLDSLLRVTQVESPAYSEALYWRAALATAAVDAERDYGRLLIEFPLSARAEDAMLQLAQLEQARGDRRAATDHLQRFLLSYPNNPSRPRAVVTLVRLLFEQGQVARGCEAIRTGRESIPRNNAELHNQLEFHAPRCVSLEEAPPAVAASDSGKPPAPTPRAVSSDTSARTSTPSPPRPATAPASTATSESAFYSVQVAAYESREPAARMAVSLVSRGLEARVDGSVRPFRVRVGKYATRADAVSAASTLKAQGIGGFVTLVQRDK